MPHVQSSPLTRAESNRRNGQNSTGPKSAEGKAKVAANATKEGFFAAIDKLNPADAPAYRQIFADLTAGLHPADPAEAHLVREVAMLSARLQRIEAAELCLLSNRAASDPVDEAGLAIAYQTCLCSLDRLSKIETQLRRASNRAWDRLERMQKERLKAIAPVSESKTGKQSQSGLTRAGYKDDGMLADYQRRVRELEFAFADISAASDKATDEAQAGTPSAHSATRVARKPV